MVIVKNEKIHNIPTLHVVQKANKDCPLPTVIYSHGFTSAKEHNLPFAYLMAEKGYRVLLPDSILHGERADGKTEDEIQFEFWKIVAQNLKELDVLKQFIEEKNLLLNGRIGLAGTSMGGISTSAALTQYSWIKVAAVLMGSPKAMEMAEYTIQQVRQSGVKLPFTEDELKQQVQELEAIDLSKHVHKLAQRPVLFWHGDQDRVVPFQQSFSFYESTIETYQNREDFRYIREKGKDHKVTRNAILETVNWFSKYL
ncbi:esterase [Salinibacillus xinjiangensis]|uniref:Esterase n=1 Tax=Salinibacillus xinjiangensis TaxID=1229268 RepID=A0A6G1X801_9BACI|nr:esterase [Salinibacillus xinjiangensis]MRG87059.1 esterase [Salinibacillus xinjiangensis]